MAVASYLVDNSVFARQAKPVVAERLDPLSQQGLLALCGIAMMELQVSARRSKDLKFLRLAFETFERLAMPDDIWDRALGGRFGAPNGRG